MRKIFLIILIVISVVLGSCSKKSSGGNLYVPTSVDVTSTATLAELTEGRALCVNNCGNCHNLHSPDDYTASGWRSVLSAMIPRTGMNSSQATLVTKYVTRGI